jgi:hypothetical protein
MGESRIDQGLVLQKGHMLERHPDLFLRNIGLQRVEANGLALSTRSSVDAVTLNRLIADA